MVTIANKDARGKYSNAQTGAFLMTHPEKFAGHETPVYKSKLEYCFMRYADTNPAIIQWGYETTNIKYLDLSSNPAKVRRYYIDFVCKVKIGDVIKTVWVEIKPFCETHKPRANANPKTLLTWVKNSCKWKAATLLAKSKGYEFKILTEKELE